MTHGPTEPDELSLAIDCNGFGSCYLAHFWKNGKNIKTKNILIHGTDKLTQEEIPLSKILHLLKMMVADCVSLPEDVTEPTTVKRRESFFLYG